MKKVFISIIAVVFTTCAFSQTALKLGHINSQELLQAMPESDSAQVET